MKGCSIERLTILELGLFRQRNLILGNREVSVVLVHQVDGANPLILGNHGIHSRELEAFTFSGEWSLQFVLCFQLGIQVRTGLLQVGLIDIKDLVHVKFRIDVVLGLLLIAELLVVLVAYLLLGVLVHYGEAG